MKLDLYDILNLVNAFFVWLAIYLFDKGLTKVNNKSTKFWVLTWSLVLFLILDISFILVIYNDKNGLMYLTELLGG